MLKYHWISLNNINFSMTIINTDKIISQETYYLFF